MIKYGNWVWEGLSTETKPGIAEGANDGHVFKELDTGESYTRVAGVWEYINLGLSFIKATKSGRIVTNSSGYYHVTFVTPFIDANYTVALSCEDNGTIQPAVAGFYNITTSGFDIRSRYTRTGNVRPSTVVSWVATRDYNP